MSIDYVPDTVLSTGDGEMNKSEEASAFSTACFHSM